MEIHMFPKRTLISKRQTGGGPGPIKKTSVVLNQPTLHFAATATSCGSWLLLVFYWHPDVGQVQLCPAGPNVGQLWLPFLSSRKRPELGQHVAQLFIGMYQGHIRHNRADPQQIENSHPGLVLHI